MIKKISPFFTRLIPVAVFLLLPIGCAVKQLPEASVESAPAYRSELADPEAKALYAYTQYRLLAVDNRWDEAINALRRAVAFDPASTYLHMSLAKALLHKDLPEESSEILREILQQAPDNFEAHELLGDLLGYQGQNEEAVEHFRQALTLDPENEMVRMRLAMALGRMGENDEAISLLEAMVAKQPEAKLAHLSLARFYLENRQPEKAKQTYQRLLDRHPDQQQAILEYGRLLEEQELFPEAFALYREGIRQNPRTVSVRQQLALLYLHQGRKAEALEQLQAVRQLAPLNTQALSRIGLLHLDLEDWAEAEADFHQLLQFGEDDGRNRYYLGLALLGQQKYQDAIKVMAPIEKTSPVFAEAVLQLAYIYRQSGQLELAIDALEKLRELNFQRPEVYYYLASFYGDGKQLEQASAVVAEGLSRYPENIELLYQSAILEEQQGRRKEALMLMEQILSLDPEHADALNFIAYHHAEKGTELDSALNQVQKALSTKRTGYIIDTLGWIYFKMGRYAESRSQLEEATSLLPEDPVILEHLGDLYRALNLWERAAEAYRKALELDSLAVGVQQKLDELPLEHTE
ncbi:tetratricopeptide repeat protein [Malonomonas rubra]|uniref:tetratricopeptide repeat protein n=1 Tax=Malonomonas rubra TaxID=57040 RepID=UPI0026F0083D|nr:tetratricopeptide repeat protein [Malonomonas rubra]